MTKLHKYIFIGLAMIFTSSFAFPKISFACWTGVDYQEDCCELGYWDMGEYCCKTWEDCFDNNYKNCRYNSYRIFNPCVPPPDTDCTIEDLLNDEKKIDTLRRFRDEVLSTTPVGREYIRLYYQWSPVIARAMEADAEFKQEVKELIEKLLPMIEAMVK